MIQTKSGFLYGVRGAEVLSVDLDNGTPIGEPHWIDTPHTVGIKMLIETGEKFVTKIQDIGVTDYEEEDDVLLGVDLDFANAKLDLLAQDAMLPGSVRTQGEEAVGWNAPGLQPAKKRFQLKVYVQNIAPSGQRDAYLCYIFPFCRAVPGDSTHQGGAFSPSTMAIKARILPSSGDGPYYNEFVESLPASAG